MSEAEEIAEAVQSLAKTGEVAIEATRALGEFFARVFKESTEEVAGMLTDKLRFVRWRRMMRMSDEVSRTLRVRRVEETRPVPPKLALPIFEESSLEEDDELHTLWCNLLANAMDPNFDGEIRVCFVDMLKTITSTDARILDLMYKDVKRYDRLNDLSQLSGHAFAGKMLASRLNIGSDAYLVSAYNLMRLQCVAATVLEPMASSPPGTRMRWDMGPGEIALTPLGLRFIGACMGSPKDGTTGVPST